MRARIDNSVLFICNEDTPPYKKKGSVVRNSYFWALKSISDRAPFQKDWEFEERVWIALVRMLIAFAESGYLGLKETQLEFDPNDTIPELLRPVSTWYDPSDYKDADTDNRPPWALT